MSERVKRWMLNANSVRSWLEEDEDGTWVAYPDYAALLKSAEALAGALEACKSKHLGCFVYSNHDESDGRCAECKQADAALKAHREGK